MIYVQVVIDGLIVGLMFALVAMGLSLIYGVMNIINFAHGEFMMLAMYACFFLWSLLGLDPLIATPIATVILFLFGVSVYRLLGRYLVGATLIPQIFGTFGLAVFLQAAANFLWKANVQTVGDNWSSGYFQIAGVFFTKAEVVAAGGALLTALALVWFINRTETGLALQATAEDPQVARLMGINTDRMFALAWGLSTATVAVGGGLLASYYAIYPLVGSRWVLPAFVAVAIGGFGNIAGAFYGGLIIGLVQVLGGFFTSPNYKMIFVYALFLLVVLLRPQGLVGRK